jgi:predicted RNA-binding protein Jag
MENLKSKDSLEFEFEGKSVEDAVKKAVSALKIHRKHLNIKVVSEEQKGLFGMAGAKPAHIIVSAINVGNDKYPRKKA